MGWMAVAYTVHDKKAVWWRVHEGRAGSGVECIIRYFWVVVRMKGGLGVVEFIEGEFWVRWSMSGWLKVVDSTR